MAISVSWVSADAASTNTNSKAADLSGAAVGDIMIAAVTLSATTGAITPPAGWTLIATGTNAGSTTSRTAAYWKRKASVAETSATFSWSATVHCTVFVVSYSGCHPTAPIEGAGYISGTGAGTWTTTSVTPTGTGRWILSVGQVVATGSLQTLTTASLTNRRNGSYSTSSPYNYCALFDTNGTVTAAAHTYNLTSGGGVSGGLVTFALIPALVLSGAATTTATASGTLKVTHNLTGSAITTATASGTFVHSTPTVPELKTWAVGDLLDEDTLNEQWRDVFLVLLGDKRPILSASYQGAAFNLTSPQAMPLDTIELKRSDMTLTPGDSKIYIGTAGWYEGMIQGCFGYTGVTTSNWVGTQLRVNGSVNASSREASIPSSLTSNAQVLGGHPFNVYLDVGDYVEIVQYGSWTAGTVKSNTTNGGTRIAIWWGGRTD